MHRIDFNYLTANALRELASALKRSADNSGDFNGQDVCLIMAPSAAETNTFIHYLLSREMVIKKEFGEDYITSITTKDEKNKVCYQGKNNTIFANYPRFRDISYGAYNQSSFVKDFYQATILEKALVNTQSIRGILFVLDADLIPCNYLEHLKILVDNIVKTLNLSPEMSDSIKFIVPISKPVPLSVEQVKDTLKQYMTSLSEHYQRNNEIEMAKWCEILLSRSVIVDYFDQGEGRESLYRTIAELKPIPLSQFNFKHYSRTMLADLPYALAEVLENITQLLAQERQTEEKLKNHNIKLKELESHKYYHLNPYSEFLQNRKNECLEKIGEREAVSQQLELLEDAINATLAQIEAKKLVLNAIDNDEAVMHWQDSIHEKRSSFMLLGFLEYTKKQFNYSGLPFDDIYIDFENGRLSQQLIDKEKGIFQATYESNLGYPGDASVRIIINNKNLPENKKMIELYKSQLQDWENDLLELEQKQNQSIEKYEALSREINQIQNLTNEQLKMHSAGIDKNNDETLITEKEIKATDRELMEIYLKLAHATNGFQLESAKEYIKIINENHAAFNIDEAIISRINNALANYIELTSEKSVQDTNESQQISNAAKLLQHHGLNRLVARNETTQVESATTETTPKIR